MVQYWLFQIMSIITVHRKMRPKVIKEYSQEEKAFFSYGRNLHQTHAPGSMWVVICPDQLGYNKGKERKVVSYIACFQISSVYTSSLLAPCAKNVFFFLFHVWHRCPLSLQFIIAGFDRPCLSLFK